MIRRSDWTVNVRLCVGQQERDLLLCRELLNNTAIASRLLVRSSAPQYPRLDVQRAPSRPAASGRRTALVADGPRTPIALPIPGSCASVFSPPDLLSSDNSAPFRPATTSVPSVGVSRHESRSIRAIFPDPDGPED